MEKGTCVHFSGTVNKACKCGVVYRDVSRPELGEFGIALRMPCTAKTGRFSAAQLEHVKNKGSCDKYQEPTAEQIAEYEAAIEASRKRFLSSLPLIRRVKQEHKGEDWKGVETCPACNGRLHMTHAKYNGHVWGQCETKGCLSWME